MSADRSGELGWAEGVQSVMMTAGVLARRTGVDDVRFGYEIIGRILLARDGQPRPDDTVEWFFASTRVVKIRGQRPFAVDTTGTSRVAPGGDHVLGCALAACEYLDKLGVAVTPADLGVVR